MLSVTPAGKFVGWGEQRYPEVYEKINAFQPPNRLSGADRILWRHDQDVFKASFSSVRTWDFLRQRRNKETWSKIVWFAQAVPRHSFMTWLAFRNRLSTDDRMRTWEIQQRCVLCGEWDETRNQLFFACPYFFMVWPNTAGWLLGSDITPDGDDTISSLLQNTRSRVDKTLWRMVFQTVIYAISRERNSRRHGGVWVSVDKLTHSIDRHIRNRISSLHYSWVILWSDCSGDGLKFFHKYTRLSFFSLFYS